MLFSILTIFPDLLASPLQEGIIKKARNEGKININITDIRGFATDRHAMTDDRPFGGGEGMVMKPEPLAAAVKHVNTSAKNESRTILLSPQGRLFTQAVAEELKAEKHLALICGRYEGIDERFRAKYVSDEISIGDFILTGGELGAMVIIDSVCRLIPGVLGCSASAENDTFSRSLLKHPQFTRPRIFEDIEIPEVLLSGNHDKIWQYRFVASVKRTLLRRPDLILKESFSKKELAVLKDHGLDREIEALKTSV